MDIVIVILLALILLSNNPLTPSMYSWIRNRISSVRHSIKKVTRR